MLQEILIGLIFTGALGYVGRLGYRQFFTSGQAGCAKSCGGCGTLDVARIQQQIEQAAANRTAR